MSIAQRTCKIEGCEKKYYSKGYCKMHYTRNRTHGDPNFTLTAPHGEPLEYFYKNIKLETDSCICWPYNKLRSGYGKVIHKGKKTLVHRLALLLTLGEPPEDKPLALHKPETCHNRACFNPRHLYWGSHKDNTADQLIDGTDIRGENHGRSKLTEAQVLEIRADDRLHRIIAEEYGVSRATVGFVKTRKMWKHI